LDYKSELNYTEHLAELSLFQDFFATGDVDSSINEDNFKINLTKNLNNEKIEKLILNPGFIGLEEKEMRAAVSDWVTEVDNDV
jgi:hypothetical protein